MARNSVELMGTPDGLFYWIPGEMVVVARLRAASGGWKHRRFWSSRYALSSTRCWLVTAYYWKPTARLDAGRMQRREPPCAARSSSAGIANNR